MLCEVVASDNLVCITGAGISRTLIRDDGHRLPDWKSLLVELFDQFKHRLATADQDDCETILAEAEPAGSRLIEVASIIRTVHPNEFDRALRKLTTPRLGEIGSTHRALRNLYSRGILTFNYDDGHENAANEVGIPLQVFLPTDEGEMTDALRDGLSQPFLLKAHGSIRAGAGALPGASPVLTFESYRALLVRNPAYRAFVQNLFTNFHLLIVGFGMSDPDFDVFIETMAQQFGGPVHCHVLIRHEDARSAEEVELRRRYGIHTLYLSDWSDLDIVLSEAPRTPGPTLRQAVDDCVSADHRVRVAAHQFLRRLGPAGRRCASESILTRFRTELNHFRASELAYALGVVDLAGNKQALMQILEKATSVPVAARALSVLRSALEPSDLPWLDDWWSNVGSHLSGRHPDRLSSYIEYYHVYIPAKFASDLDA